MKKHWFKVLAVIWATINALYYLAIRSCWSFISGTLGADNNQSFLIINAPFIILGLILLTTVLSYVFLIFLKKGKKWAIVINSINLLFTIGFVASFFMGFYGFMYYFFPLFGKYLLIASGLYILYFAIFRIPKLKIKRPILLKSLIFTVILGVTASFLIDFSVNRITYHSVVYAVEDDYQIVFSSKRKSYAWVEIDGVDYYDLSAGVSRSEDLVHKITVPMSVLDAAEEYSIHVKAIIYKAPFYGYTGREITESYNFNPINYDDGINYYTLSDVHHAVKGAIESALNSGDMDFLVVAGDIVSALERYQDLELTNKLAYEITKGEIPVVYARGNHETTGKYSEEFYKYVGSVNQEFYYYYNLNVYSDSFKVGEIRGLVLDLGVDHNDDWWEYYQTSHCLDYETKQLDFIDDYTLFMIADIPLLFNYKMVVCHIPLVIVDKKLDHSDMITQMTDKLNNLSLDISLSGHTHYLYVFEPGLIEADTALSFSSLYTPSASESLSNHVTDFNFYSFVASKRSYTQTEKSEVIKTDAFIGLHINVVQNGILGGNTTDASYINSRGEKVSIVNAFYEKSYGEDIIYNS
ncbi:MAG: metallophosphoesterase [Bacillales bacterium]|nr:metallophosphoesterase [Bacillales bacterium]